MNNFMKTCKLLPIGHMINSTPKISSVVFNRSLSTVSLKNKLPDDEAFKEYEIKSFKKSPDDLRIFTSKQFQCSMDDAIKEKNLSNIANHYLRSRFHLKLDSFSEFLCSSYITYSVINIGDQSLLWLSLCGMPTLIWTIRNVRINHAVSEMGKKVLKENITNESFNALKKEGYSPGEEEKITDILELKNK